MKGMFTSLGVLNYRIWFFGALVSNVGTWMQATAQDWVVLAELTDNNAGAVGVTMALQFVPQLVLFPLTGAIADRFDRRKVLLVTQATLAALGMTLGLLLLGGHAQLWHVYIMAFLLGVTNAFDVPARQVFVTDLVKSKMVANAIALNSASFNSARLIGPALAGLLIVIFGSGWVFIINGASFFMVIGSLLLLRVNELVPRKEINRKDMPFSAGFKYLATRPDLIVVFAIIFIVSAFGLNFPIYASTMAVEFGKGAGEYGVLSSILAIGSLAASLMAARAKRARMRMIMISAGLFGAATGIASLMPTYETFAVSLIFVGFSSVMMLVTANGMVQSTTHAQYRGRIMAMYTAVLMGATPFGAPVIGWLADVLEPRWALYLAALAGVIGFLVGVTWLIIARGLRLKYERTPKRRLRLVHPGIINDDEKFLLTAPLPIITMTMPIQEIDDESED